MKLRNKKTGEIGNLVLNINPNRESFAMLSIENGDTLCANLVIGDYDSLAELNEEWEDYEELKTFWAISWAGEPEEYDAKKTPQELKDMAKEIGNYFETKEEAEKAAEKLKAWKRLKDVGFKFIGKSYEYKEDKHFGSVFFETDPHKKIREFYEDNVDFYDDINTIFGGENE